MVSLSANDVLEVGAGCLPKVETDSIDRHLRHALRLTHGQGLSAEAGKPYCAGQLARENSFQNEEGAGVSESDFKKRGL